MTTKTGTYPLRLPLTLKAAVEKLAKRDGTSVNQFVVVAVAEKLSAMATADYLQTTTKVTWPTLGTRPAVAASSIISPRAWAASNPKIRSGRAIVATSADLISP